MKRLLYLLSFFLLLSTATLAQGGHDAGGEKIRELMTESIQKRLGLSRAEAERFGPVFLNYVKDQRKIARDFSGDRLVLQQKIVELRLQYRDQFRPIIGEKRSNDVFTYERDFVDEVKKVRQERMQNKNDRFNKRIESILQ
ncbi:hypothetical protein V9K67_12655 [Paraflavisolibacter sp. H34]|uniref:hypothetical protein n=1 Tax=Huijunlia imazamoxiresistens TaxID=3127457 RepID=UPI003015F3C8